MNPFPELVPLSSSRPKLQVYSDYVCPFCYIGKASLQKFLQETDDPPPVQWEPFDLRGYKRDEDGTIRHDVDDGKDEQYFEEVRKNVRRLKDKYDLEMNLDFSLEVDSWKAHKAALFVRENEDDETFQAFHEAVFDALWKQGRDIGDPEVLEDLTNQVGMDPGPLLSALENESLEKQLQSRLERARSMGIRAVPLFVYDSHAARGAVPPSQLRRLVNEN